MLLDADTLRAQARGCGILGAGGGGSPAMGLLASLRALELHGPTTLVDLDDLPDDELVLPMGMVGAPTVAVEKIANGGEARWIVERVEEVTGRKVAALMSSEIGGANGLFPMEFAGALGLPIVDADGMGRAFPEMPMVSMEIAGISPSPCVMSDERGNVLIVHPADGAWLERLCRATAVAFGGRAVSSEYLMSVAEARTGAVRGTVSLAIRIGRALDHAEGDPVEALLREVNGFRLIEGKVVDVDRRVTGGFTRGSAQIDGLRADSGRQLRLELQNENLVALEGERVLATVPDIITVLDTQTGDAVSTELLRYGQRVTVIAFPCDPVWRSEGGLRLTSPRAFGYDFDFRPVEEIHRGRA
jgi:hypothetical protein